MRIVAIDAFGAASHIQAPRHEPAAAAPKSGATRRTEPRHGAGAARRTATRRRPRARPVAVRRVALGRGARVRRAARFSGASWRPCVPALAACALCRLWLVVACVVSLPWCVLADSARRRCVSRWSVRRVSSFLRLGAPGLLLSARAAGLQFGIARLPSLLCEKLDFYPFQLGVRCYVRR